MTKDKALKLALEALMRSRKAVSGDLDLAGCAYGSNDPDGHRYDDAKKALVTLDKAITALREALAQQEPVAWALYQRDRLLSFWMDKGDAYDFEFTTEHRWEPLYTSPPAQRTWVGLTLDEIDAEWGLFMSGRGSGYIPDFVHAIEAKLREKNT